VEQPQEALQEQEQAALRQATQAGLEAETLLHSPILAAWFLDTNNGLISRLGEVTLGDKEARCRIVDLMWLLQQLRQYMEMTMHAGYDAKRDLDRLLGERKQSITDIPYDG